MKMKIILKMILMAVLFFPIIWARGLDIMMVIVTTMTMMIMLRNMMVVIVSKMSRTLPQWATGPYHLGTGLGEPLDRLVVGRGPVPVQAARPGPDCRLLPGPVTGDSGTGRVYDRVSARPSQLTWTDHCSFTTSAATACAIIIIIIIIVIIVIIVVVLLTKITLTSNNDHI